jgi:hypothetical protein
MSSVSSGMKSEYLSKFADDHKTNLGYEPVAKAKMFGE